MGRRKKEKYSRTIVKGDFKVDPYLKKIISQIKLLRMGKQSLGD